MPGTPVHQRTVAHKAAVLEWVTGLAADAGAPDPRGLARSLTLLLDGGLASGALDADPEAATRAAGSARVLVDAALSVTPADRTGGAASGRGPMRGAARPTARPR